MSDDSDTFEDGMAPGSTPQLRAKKQSATGSRKKKGARKKAGPRCQHCSASLKGGQRFCNKCGKAQAAEAEDSSDADSLESEMTQRTMPTPVKTTTQRQSEEELPQIIVSQVAENSDEAEEIIYEEEVIVIEEEQEVEEEFEIVEEIVIVEEMVEEENEGDLATMDTTTVALTQSFMDEDGDEEEEDSSGGGSPKLRNRNSVRGLKRESNEASTTSTTTGGEMAEMALFFEKHRLTRERLEGSAGMLLEKLRTLKAKPEASADSKSSKGLVGGNTANIDRSEWEEYNVDDPLFPFIALAKEARNLYLPHSISVLKQPLDALNFYREYVSPNVPVVMRKAQTEWNASSELWTNAYLRSAMGDREVHVAATPKGRADYIRNGKFVLPEERLMKFSEFMDVLESGKRSKKGHLYLSHQNGNFTSEFEPLHKDAAAPISWAVEAFGCVPDAVNIWIGDSRAVSSCHKDFYENIFMVISGEKHFTLLPPTDFPFLYERSFPVAQFRQDEDTKWRVYDDAQSQPVPWIAVDPDSPDLTEFPLYSHTHPYKVTVKAGQCLYLPAMWYHQVSQSADEHGRCIAINMWFDMRYETKFNYRNFLVNMSKLHGL